MVQLIDKELMNSLLIGSRIKPMARHIPAIVEPIWPMLQNISKTLARMNVCARVCACVCVCARVCVCDLSHSY